MPPRPNKPRFHQPFSWRTFALGVGVTAMIMAVLIAYPGVLTFLELKISDLRMNARTPHPPTNQVVVVGIDQKSIAVLGHWPWPRDVMAQFQDALASYRPKVIGYDLLFSEADSDVAERREIASRLTVLGLRSAQIQEALGRERDQKFAHAVKAQGDTYLGYGFARHELGRGVGGPEAGYLRDAINPPPLAYTLVHRAPGAAPELFHADAYLPPTAILNSAARGTGFYDIEGDSDGEIRTELTVISFHGRMCVPFFLAVAQAYYGGAALRLNLVPAGVSSVALGDIVILVDEIGRMMVTFRGGARSFPHYSAVDVLEHRIAPDALAGKAVLIGAIAKAIGDRAVTPAGPEFPRVEIHANAIDDVIAHDFIDATRTDTVAMERIWAIALGVAISFAVAYLTASIAFAAVLALIMAYFGFAQYLLIADRILLGVVFPLAVALGAAGALAIYRYWTEGLEKRYLRHAFEHYLHPDVIAVLMENPKQLQLGGERKIVTILFADIINYTGLSERTDPAALVTLLNDYMTKMTDQILESGGVVDKIRGDGIMAFWGAPLEVPNHPRAAIDSGIAMLTELKSLREHDPRFADIDIGVGIATGEAIAGNFGGARRFDYSVIGDTVNLASRLEGLTRQFKVHLLVSKETFSQAGGAYVARDIGLVRVKGKTIPVPIVEVVAAASGNGAEGAYYQRFAAVLEDLRGGANEDARRTLEAMRVDRPDDGVIAMYLEKLADSALRPAGEMVFEFDTK
ncbi:MAG TPA: adenylate/guanylate cyclase domain-containing protein [Candidatus Binataceae bacterium]|nr:adenylate/guanylate cyclase domain-containing protein [Candidatus Binataceae bacterium]